MSWTDFIFGRKPKRKGDMRATNLESASVNHTPIDPTLESAAKEASAQIKIKADQIKTISEEIVEMTSSLLKQFETKSNEQPPPK